MVKCDCKSRIKETTIPFTRASSYIRAILKLIGHFVATVSPSILKVMGTVGCLNGKLNTCQMCP